MERQPIQREKEKTPVVFTNYFKPITQGFEEESCQYCSYCDQDIDTYPCAKCHTRH